MRACVLMQEDALFFLLIKEENLCVVDHVSEICQVFVYKSLGPKSVFHY